MAARWNFVASLRRLRERVAVERAANAADAPDLAVEIREAIEVACRIADLRVLIAGPLITLTGTAADETTCEHAAAIAKRLAPDALGVINHLAVATSQR
jgi:hypothetical protein